MKRSFAIKCEEYSLINSVNDEYLKINKNLKDENKELKTKLGSLQQEVAEIKVQKLRTSKPFVDLTCDDDSDIEIVEEKVSEGVKKAITEIIDLEDEVRASQNNSPIRAPIDKDSRQTIPKDKVDFSKNSAAMDESSLNQEMQTPWLNDLQRFENFILEQIWFYAVTVKWDLNFAIRNIYEVFLKEEK